MTRPRFFSLGMLVVLAVLLRIPTHSAAVTAAATPKPPQAASEPIELIGSFGGSIRAIAVSGSFAYITEGSTLAILDISNPAQPVRRSFIQLPGRPSDVQVANGMAYAIFDSRGIQIIDVRDPDRPRLRGIYQEPAPYLYNLHVVGSMIYVLFSHHDRIFGFQMIDAADPDRPVMRGGYGSWLESVSDLEIVGNLVYLTANAEQDFKIIDVADPMHPIVRGAYDTPGTADSVAVVDQFAYIADQGAEDQLSIIDVSDPSRPTLRGSFQQGGMEIDDVQVVGTIAYLVDQGSDYLHILDIARPERPTVVSEYRVAHGIDRLLATPDHAFVTTFSRIEILDFSKPPHPRVAGSYTGVGFVSGVEVVGDIAYVFGSELQIVDMRTPAAPQVRSRIQIPTQGAGRDLRVVASKAYPISNLGLYIVDVHDPDQPTLLGMFPLTNAEAVDVVGNLAYVVTTTAIEIIGVADPARPVRRGSYAYEQYEFFSPRELQVIGNYIYFVFRATYDTFELHIVDVSDPERPQLRGKRAVPSGSNLHVVGARAYIAGSDLAIVDVGNPEQPQVLTAYATMARDVQVVGRLAYLVGWEGDPDWDDGMLRIVDVGLPNNPRLLGAYPLPTAMYEVVVAGDLVYVQTEGLRIFRIHPGRLPSSIFLPRID